MQFSKNNSLKICLVTAMVVVSSAGFAGAPIEADLLASYAASYASSVGGEDNAQVIIANTVAGSNAIQDQGGTGAHMRIAGFYQSAIDVTGQTSTGGIVNWLASNDSHLSDVVAQGAALGADLVVYICNNNDSSSIAGVSQQPGFYSALNPGAVWSAVFAHETGGHAYGRSHSDGILNPKTIMLHNYCGGGAAPPYFYTNPNIWFNGVQLLGDGVNNCGMGGLVNGGDNSSPSAQAVADRRARVVTAPNLNNVVLHWAFTNAPGSAPAGTTNLDLISGAQAIVRGNGASYTGTALRIPGGTTGNVAMNSMSAYIDLPNGIISSQTNITIEIWATPLSAPNWARIFDFGRCTQSGDGLGAAGEYTGATSDPAPGTTTSYDDIMLSAAIGTDITQQRFEAKLAGYATTLDSALATTAGVQHHYAITFTDGAGAAGSAGGRWQWFRDGDAIAYLDVTNHLADIHDVNNWLGRSMWSADNNANNDYAEVRISSVAMSRNEILANFLLGPNYTSTANVTLQNSDATGASSFNAAGQWSNGSAPSAGNNYETYDFQLRTPASSGSFSFAGSSLKISGGALLWKGTSSGTIIVNNLTLNGGALINGGSGTCTLAGNLAVTTNGAVINSENGAATISANMSGNGPVTYLANATTLSGINSSFTGKTFVGNGMAGTLVINSQAQLGANPASFSASQLDINRGTLQTTATFSINDANRGITIDVSGATFNVNPGTTLTLASPLASPATASGVIVGTITKTGSGSLVLSNSSSSFKGTLYVDTSSTSANDGILKVANNQVLANAHSPIFIRNNNSGASVFQLDGASGNITLPQQILLSGRSTSVAAIENVAGTNTLAGGISVNVGGGNYWIQSDAGLLNLGGTVTSAASGTRTFTLMGNADFSLSGSMQNGSATTINLLKTNAGTLTISGASTFTGATTNYRGNIFVNGSLASSLTAAGGVVGGTGTVSGAVVVQSGATFSPGPRPAAIGAMAFGNSLTFAPGSTNSFEINKTSQTNDIANVTGTVNYNGTLIVTNLSGTLSLGDSFKLFNAGNYSGNFSAFALPPLGTNLIWNTGNLAVNGTISVALAAPPQFDATSLIGANLVLNGFGGAANAGYSLIGSTNLALPLTNWSLLNTGLFDTAGNFSVTNNTTNAQNQFYLLRVP
jgi:autotransporter-associated beta strand protein